MKSGINLGENNISSELYMYTTEESKGILLQFLNNIQGVPGGMCQTSGECSLS